MRSACFSRKPCKKYLYSTRLILACGIIHFTTITAGFCIYYEICNSSCSSEIVSRTQVNMFVYASYYLLYYTSYTLRTHIVEPLCHIINIRPDMSKFFRRFRTLRVPPPIAQSVSYLGEFIHSFISADYDPYLISTSVVVSRVTQLKNSQILFK